MTAQPLLNITMPVFNRLDLTQQALLALKESTRDIPFTVTVVDNGSEPELVRQLVRFKKSGVIDKLFLLPRNYGVSCACNIGWQMTDAAFYMKMDNDIVVKRSDWLARLFRLWEHVPPLSTLGGTSSMDEVRQNAAPIVTAHGTIGLCKGNLAGYGIIIPKAVSEQIGLWSEDYGLYGAEDGDYGLRMNTAGFAQYYYHQTEFYDNLGDHDNVQAVYAGRLDRQKQRMELFNDGHGGVGLFPLNNYLYKMRIRNLNVPLRYKVEDVSSFFQVKLAEREEYFPVATTLRRTQELVNARIRAGNADSLYDEGFVESLRELWRGIGQ